MEGLRLTTQHLPAGVAMIVRSSDGRCRQIGVDQESEDPARCLEGEPSLRQGSIRQGGTG